MGYQEMLRKFIETKFEKLAAKKSQGTHIAYYPEDDQFHFNGVKMNQEALMKMLLETPDTWNRVFVIRPSKQVKSIQQVFQVGNDPKNAIYMLVYSTGKGKENDVYVTFGRSLEELNQRKELIRNQYLGAKVNITINEQDIEKVSAEDFGGDFEVIKHLLDSLMVKGKGQADTNTAKDKTNPENNKTNPTNNQTKTENNQTNTNPTDNQTKTENKKTDTNPTNNQTNKRGIPIEPFKIRYRPTGTNQPSGQSNSSAKITPLQAGLIAGAAALPAAFIISEAIREKKRQERDKQLREVLNPNMVYHIAKNASDRRLEKFAARVQAATVAPEAATGATPTSTVTTTAAPATAAGASIADLIVASLAFSPLLLLIRPQKTPEDRSSAIYYSVINSPVHPALKKRADAQKKDEKENQPKQLDAAIWVPLAAAGGTLASVLASKFVTEPRATKEITIRPADPVQDAYFNPYGLGNYYLRQYEKARKARKEMLKDVYESYRSRED